MSENNINFPNSAITTWNGFIYQGELALIHTISKLIENYNLNYYLQLDSLEDFAVVKKEEGKINPISMHQVKSLKSKTYGSYTTALDKLNSKSEKCSKLFFHVARKIKNKSIQDIYKEYPNIKMYKYKDGKYYCSLDKTREKLIENCKKLYVKYFPSDNYKQEEEYLNRTIHYLIHIIMNAVNQVHIDTHANQGSDNELAYNKLISFRDFKKIFSSDLNEMGDNSEYYKMLAVEDFNRYFESFKYSFEDKFKQSELNKILKYVQYINNFNMIEMEQFIKSVTPHRSFKFDSIQDYKDGGLQKDEMEFVFFNMLGELRKGEIKGYQIQWECIEGNCYTPTSVDTNEAYKEQICARIIENGIDNDVIMLFEGQTFITENLQSKSIFNDANDSIEVDEYDEKHILSAKNISLEKLTRAKEILNDRDD